jgi:hypothetical protein
LSLIPGWGKNLCMKSPTRVCIYVGTHLGMQFFKQRSLSTFQYRFRYPCTFPSEKALEYMD